MLQGVEVIHHLEFAKAGPEKRTRKELLQTLGGYALAAGAALTAIIVNDEIGKINVPATLGCGAGLILGLRTAWKATVAPQYRELEKSLYGIATVPENPILDIDFKALEERFGAYGRWNVALGAYYSDTHGVEIDFSTPVETTGLDMEFSLLCLKDYLGLEDETRKPTGKVEVGTEDYGPGAQCIYVHYTGPTDQRFSDLVTRLYEMDARTKTASFSS